MCIIRQLMYKHSIIDCYPRLLDDETSAAPDPCESSVSTSSTAGSNDADSPRSRGNRAFRLPRSKQSFDKFSQDIMIFKKIAEIMPPKSLLHLLHGAQRTSPSRRPEQSIEDDDDAPVRRPPRSMSMRKQRIRFEENVYGEVKRVVHEIPRISDPSLWWQSKEYSEIRAGCKTLAEHYLQYKEEYLKAVERLLSTKPDSSTRKIEKSMECMLNNTISRGLESHIVQDCRAVCRKHRRDVLKAQEKVFKRELDHTEEGRDKIYRASSKASRGSRFLAVKLAQQDTFLTMGRRWKREDHMLDLV